MKNTLTTLITLLLVLASASAAFAQTIVTTTTLGAALNATSTTVTFGSVTGTNFAVGNFVFTEHELMQIQANINTTALTATVVRGVGGTQAATHANSAVVYVGPGQQFFHTDPVGTTCTRGTYPADILPHVNVDNGHVWTCRQSVWNGADTLTLTYNSTVPSAWLNQPTSIWAWMERLVWDWS